MASEQSRWIDEIRTDRVVIIEWLPNGERRTGKELADRMATWSVRNKIELVCCEDAGSVMLAIDQARESIPTKGVPILHVESHGAAGPEGGLSRDGSELLQWRRLREPLRALNLATGFQLLVVGAACYGDGFIWGIGDMAPSPFLACVGFPQEITGAAVFRLMLEFYRALLVRRENVEVAVESARLEASNPQTEYLRFMTARTLLMQSLVKYFENEAAESESERFTRVVIDAAKMMMKSPGSMLWSIAFARAVAADEFATLDAANRVTAKILALDLLPGNRQRFAVDVPEIMRQARRKRAVDSDQN